MATVNLGSIKFKWKGTYSGATAYTVDDVVEYNGSSYICKLASTGNLPTNTTYFDVMSSAGTNGTDLTSTLTTQGDILYRDGSGLQRLGAGTSGQALLTQGAGANPIWGSVAGGKILQVVYGQHSSYSSTTSTSYVDLSASTNVTITPSATSSKILVIAHFNEVYKNGSHSGALQVTENGTMVARIGQCLFLPNYTGEMMDNYDFIFVRSPSSTSAIQYKLQFRSVGGGAINVCQDNHPASSLTLMEIGA